MCEVVIVTREWRREFEASVESAFDVMSAAQGRDYTIIEIEELLTELAAASGLLSRQPGAQAALARAVRRVMERKLGQP
jgi:geranylgeranyl pyrophosphate synthase